MQLSYQEQPLKHSQPLELKSTVKHAVQDFLRANNLAHIDCPELTLNNNNLFLHSHESLRTALAVFKLQDVINLAPITRQEADNAHQLFKVYDLKCNNGIWSVMFDYTDQSLLPQTKEQAAFMLVAPYLKEMPRATQSANPSFLTVLQKQALWSESKAVANILTPALKQRESCKADLKAGNLLRIFKMALRNETSAVKQVTESDHKIIVINKNLGLWQTCNPGQKVILSESLKVLIDQLWALRECEGFEIGTLVRTENDYQKIEDIKPGQIVVAFDTQKQELTARKVLATYKEHVSSYALITFTDTTIKTAVDQKLYIPSQDVWVTAEELSKSAELQANLPDAILDIKIVPEPTDICKLTVEQDHNFFVTEHDILAHNVIPCVVIPAAGAAAPFGMFS